MYIDFMGTDAAIFRSLTKRNAVRTDQHNSKWLSGKMIVSQSFWYVSNRKSDVFLKPFYYLPCHVNLLSETMRKKQE